MECDQVKDILDKAGFFTSRYCDVRPSSFDLVARKDNLLLIIKFLNNVDSLNAIVARELRLLAKFLEGISILIGKKSSSGKLKDGAAYLRYGIPIMTYPTFKEYVLEESSPMIYASPGGFHIDIDGDRLRELREKMEISLGYVARIAGVSRRTIGMYEQGMKASIEVVSRLEEFFGEPIAKPVDFSFHLKIEKCEIDFEGFQGEVFSRLQEVGCSIFPTSRSPFNALSKALSELILVGISEKNLRKVRTISNISKVMEKHSVFFVEKSMKENINGTPLIERRELEKINEPEKIMELILEREK